MIHTLDIPIHDPHPLPGCYSTQGYRQHVMQLVSHNDELSIFISNILHVYTMASL